MYHYWMGKHYVSLKAKAAAPSDLWFNYMRLCKAVISSVQPRLVELHGCYGSDCAIWIFQLFFKQNFKGSDFLEDEVSNEIFVELGM